MDETRKAWWHRIDDARSLTDMEQVEAALVTQDGPWVGPMRDKLINRRLQRKATGWGR